MKLYLYIILILFINIHSVYGKESRFSGEPIPRFVSISKSPLSTRVGPSVKYPIKYIYQAKFQPVKVINEYYGWYQIEDVENDSSWINKNSTSKAKYAISVNDNTKLYEKNKLTSDIIAKINKGVVVKVVECSENLCNVEVNFNGQPFKGFVIQNELWGI